MKQYFRKLAQKFFRQWIKVYWSQIVVSDEELVMSEGKVEVYVKEEIAHRLAKQLMEDGMIEFEKRKDMQTANIIISGKIRVI